MFYVAENKNIMIIVAMILIVIAELKNKSDVN